MEKIFKYDVPINDKVAIDLPMGTKIIAVDSVRIQVFIWAIVEEDKSVFETRFFEVFATGQGMPLMHSGSREYLGTCLLDDGSFVVHVFERIQADD